MYDWWIRKGSPHAYEVSVAEGENRGKNFTISEKAEHAIGKAKDAAREYLGEFTGGSGKTAKEYAKIATANLLSFFSDTIEATDHGEVTEKEKEELVNLANIVTNINQPLSFTVKGGKNGGSEYEVVWGDSEKSTGMVPKEAIKTLRHAWKKEGNYTAQMKVVNGNTKYNYSFPIRVVK